MGNDEVMQKLLDNSNKSLKLQKIRTVCVLVILVAVGISIFAIVPRVVSTLDKIETAATSVYETIGKAEATIDNIDKMAESLKSTGDNMNSILNDNGDKLTESLDKMANIDFDGLNQGIKDLQDAIGPLANFMNKFR